LKTKAKNAVTCRNAEKIKNINLGKCCAGIPENVNFTTSSDDKKEFDTTAAIQFLKTEVRDDDSWVSLLRI
jgi:hypothetical protein